MPRVAQQCNLPCSLTPRSGSTGPFQRYSTWYAHVFVRFRPEGPLPCEHMFCSPRTSKFTQAETGMRAGGVRLLASVARDALALTRAFLLLEDDDPVDWEVGEDELAAAPHEPAWAPAHRAVLREWQAPRRGGQPAAPPQVCLCTRRPNRNISPTPRASEPAFVTLQNQSICRASVKLGEHGAVFYAEPPSRA